MSTLTPTSFKLELINCKLMYYRNFKQKSQYPTVQTKFENNKLFYTKLVYIKKVCISYPFRDIGSLFFGAPHN